MSQVPATLDAQLVQLAGQIAEEEVYDLDIPTSHPLASSSSES